MTIVLLKKEPRCTLSYSHMCLILWCLSHMILPQDPHQLPHAAPHIPARLPAADSSSTDSSSESAPSCHRIRGTCVISLCTARILPMWTGPPSFREASPGSGVLFRYREPPVCSAAGRCAESGQTRHGAPAGRAEVLWVAKSPYQTYLSASLLQSPAASARPAMECPHLSSSVCGALDSSRFQSGSPSSWCCGGESRRPHWLAALSPFRARCAGSAHFRKVPRCRAGSAASFPRCSPAGYRRSQCFQAAPLSLPQFVCEMKPPCAGLRWPKSILNT